MYDELVKRLRDWPRVCTQYDGSVDQLHDDAADAIEELSRENESLAKSVNEASEMLRKRWIPVTERLPDVNKRVIACVSIFGKPSVWDAVRWNGEEWEAEEEAVYGYWTSIDSPVTHWMPLPEPPKEVYDEHTD